MARSAPSRAIRQFRCRFGSRQARDTGLMGAAKHAVQGTLRVLHLALFRRPLPRRVALYFHDIDPCDCRGPGCHHSFLQTAGLFVRESQGIR